MFNPSIIIKSILLVILLAIFFPAPPALANDNPICEGTVRGCLNQLKIKFGNSSSSGTGLPISSSTTILNSIIEWLLGIVAALAVLALIIGGLMYILSLGDEAKSTRAKNIIIYALLGLIVTAAAGLLVVAIGKALKII